MKTALYVIEIAAILVFAYSGMIQARKSGFDYIGVLTIALVSALGGGTIRDILLGNHPLYWIAHWEFLFYVLLLPPIPLAWPSFAGSMTHSSNPTSPIT